eukprot:10944391-Karenia_brevis.AAC.1
MGKEKPITSISTRDSGVAVKAVNEDARGRDRDICRICGKPRSEHPNRSFKGCNKRKRSRTPPRRSSR